MNENETEHFLESKEGKEIQVNLGLSVGLLSFGAVIKNIISNKNEFNLLDCLAISITAFIIIFMGLYKNEKAFKSVYDVYENKKISIFIFLFGILIIGLTLGFDFLLSLFKVSWYNILMVYIGRWISYFSISVSGIFILMPTVFLLIRQKRQMDNN